MFFKKMNHTKLLLKKAISLILVLIGRFNPKVGIPVFLYHSVDNSGSVISIAPSEFRVHMQYLKRNGYQTICLPRYVEYLRMGIRPSREVVLTFDDGFKNNYTEALPILREFVFTATVFLPTNYIGGVCLWPKDGSIPDFPLLSWDDIQEMSKLGIDFGSHTCSHPYLTKLSEDEVRSELLESKSAIETKINKPVEFFCHPYGDTNRKTQRMAEECGYMGAFGGLDFSLNNTKENLYDLTRVGIAHFSSLQDFKAGLLGTYDWYIKMKGLFLKNE